MSHVPFLPDLGTTHSNTLNALSPVWGAIGTPDIYQDMVAPPNDINIPIVIYTSFVPVSNQGLTVTMTLPHPTPNTVLVPTERLSQHPT